MSEIWKPIEGYEGLYEVSSLGRLKSIARNVTIKTKYTSYFRVTKDTILQGSKHKYGYPMFFLCKSDASHSKTLYLLHRIVALAFHGPCPDGKECAHLNGDPTDNRADNLKWVTKKENESHKILHGRTTRGERAGNSKLTERDVKEIRNRYGLGEKIVSISKDFPVRDVHVWRIVNKKRWAHI